MILPFLIEKEFKQMMRTKVLPILFIILPFVMVNVMPRTTNQEIKDLTYCVIDYDHSTFSQRLIQKLSASSYFTLVATASTYEQALQYVEEGEADLILQIEADFEKDLMTTGLSRVMVSVNAVNGLKAGIAQSYVSQMVADFSAQLREEHGLDASSTHLAYLDVEPRYLFNSELDYEKFMVPGMIAMLIVLLMGFIPAMNVVGEREKGTIEQINVTPVSRAQFILGKLVPCWLVGLFILTYAIGLAYVFYDLLPESNLMWMYVFTILFIAVVSGMGLLVSNFSDTMQQAALMMLFFLMIFILTSGLITPVASMPEWAQYFTYLNPLRYYIEIIRSLYLKGSGFMDLLPQFIALSVYLVVVWISVIGSTKKNR